MHQIEIMMDDTPPSTHQITVREAQGADDMEKIFRIRDEVFVHEQRLTSNARFDPDDRRSIHYLAEFDGNVVGTGRLTILGAEAQIAWVAVLAEYRGKGIGWALMEEMIRRAERENADYIILNAQTHALHFYQRLGFHAVGDEFKMAQIPHRVMIRSLTTGGGDSVRRFFGQFGKP